MKELNLYLGVEEYLLAGKVAVSFNPTDMNFLERFSHAFTELDALQEEVRTAHEKTTDEREVFSLARDLDGRMRGILNELFGKEICEPLFGSVNLFASSGGLPVWANLMLAITDEVQSALQGELAAREQRIAKYVEKYKLAHQMQEYMIFGILSQLSACRMETITRPCKMHWDMRQQRSRSMCTLMFLKG